MKKKLQSSHSLFCYSSIGWLTKTFLASCLVFTFMRTCYAQLPDTWTPISSLPGNSRAAAFAFAIGTKGYAGGGINFNAGGSLKDFWEYDPAADSWTQKADFGGGNRSGAVAFAIGDKGYALTGDGNSGKQKDIWEYDTLLNTWTKKTDLPSIKRNYAVAFAIGNKGYIGTGYTSSGFVSLNDFWQFDPVANTWTQKADVPGPQRSNAIGFGIDGKGYLGTGDTCFYLGCFDLNDFYCYDTLSNTWTQKANVGSTFRDGATTFVINGRGYVCTGEVNNGSTKDLLEYNPPTDAWLIRASIPGLGKSNACSFAIGMHGYVGTGYDPNFNTTSDFYEYTADTSFVATNVNEILKPSGVSIYPDPVTAESDFTIADVQDPSQISLSIFSVAGNAIASSYFEKKLTGNNQVVFHFVKNDLPEGVYFYSVKSSRSVVSTGKFIVM